VTPEPVARGRLGAIIELLRPPNVFTAVADPLAGLALVRGGAIALTDPGLWCLAASACLYLGGLALNDFFDRHVDARERPARPIPSGRVSAAFAAGLGAGLLAAGLLFAALAGGPSLFVAILLAVAIVAYDGVLKGTAAGFLAMGLCRALNMAMPMALALGTFSGTLLLVPALLGVYVLCFTILAHEEVAGSAPERVRRVLRGLAFVAIGVGAQLAAMRATAGGWILFAAVGARAVHLFRPLLSDPSPPATGRAVGGAILLIPAFDAVFVAAAGHLFWALAVASLIVPAALLRRAYSPT
jgi:4-hydroxybenzoate polyprenyltransferase